MGEDWRLTKNHVLLQKCHEKMSIIVLKVSKSGRFVTWHSRVHCFQHQQPVPMPDHPPDKNLYLIPNLTLFWCSLMLITWVHWLITIGERWKGKASSNPTLTLIFQPTLYSLLYSLKDCMLWATEDRSGRQLYKIRGGRWGILCLQSQIV